MQFVKGGFAFRAGRELGLRAPIWQRGFSEVRVNTAEQFESIRRYIRKNPLIRHLAEHPDNFLYCSAHAGFDLDPRPQGLKPDLEDVSLGTAEAVP